MTDLKQPILDRDNLNLVLDNLKLGIIAHTPDRIITVFNKEAERITGYLKEEVIGKTAIKFFTRLSAEGNVLFAMARQSFPLVQKNIH